MTTVQEKKPLTKTQYEFYKRKGMTDETVMKLHGLNTASLNAWKKENDLVGVKFEKDLVVEGNVTKTPLVKKEELLKENNIQPDKLQKSAAETEIAIKQYNANKKIQDKLKEKKPAAVESKPIQSEIDSDVTAQPEAPAKEEFKMPDVTQVDEPDYEKDIAWLNERHAADTENIRLLRADIKHLQKERYEIIERSDRWREKFLAMDEENGRLLKELESRDQMMEKSALREDYLFQTMELAQDMRKMYLSGRGAEF